MKLICLRVTILKLRSLYEYFQAYFEYPSTGNVRYGRAISDAMKITSEMMKLKSINPMIEYEKQKYSSQIAKNMLYKLLFKSKSEYKDPFNEIKYIETDICINKALLGNGRRELKIPLRCGIDIRKNTLILLVFSSKYKMEQEMGILKGLLLEFGTVYKELISVQKVAYWNLSKLEQEIMDFKNIIPVSKEKLIEAANKALNRK
jgi:hypothetical protein